MNVIFCTPELTMTNTVEAGVFFQECRAILESYMTNVQYISRSVHIRQLLAQEADQDDILVFFISEKDEYDESLIKLLRKYSDAECRVWSIAMKAEYRMPPEPVVKKQSYDIPSRMENRNPLKNNMRAIAQLFARKIIAQTLSPLYRDEVLYFLSHRRSDGEHIAKQLSDELSRLTRERNVYRDVVNVAVGDDAQQDIDRNLEQSDVLIFLQTEQAKDSCYVMKELCYALIHNIPVLWIQIDDADYTKLEILPGDAPMLRYESGEFDQADRLEEIANEVEEKCFELIMNSSNQVYTYVEYLNNVCTSNKLVFRQDRSAALAYEIEYREKTRDLYNDGIRRNYVQCFGRNPQEEDIKRFINRIRAQEVYQRNDKLFLLSTHGCRDNQLGDSKIIQENYDDYLINLENVSGRKNKQQNKRIIISGAFPDCNEIYSNSLLEALVLYTKEIIRRGYTLVFGAHPTFQKLIFDIGSLYASDVHYAIEMHMDRGYIGGYDVDELQENCTLKLADGLQEMRENMICKEKAEMLICLGGKNNKARPGVDIEVELAKRAGIPVALVGTVGGRSSECAYQRVETGRWSDLNSWDTSLNESLFYNVNHRLMAKRLLDTIEQ